MNSMSRTHFHDDNDPCSKSKIKDCKTILKCGCPSSAQFFGPGGEGATAAITTTTITSVSVNTSCFCDPCIKLEFASNIIVPTTTLSATLNFQVFKLCDNKFLPTSVGPVWTFSRAAISTSDTFTFLICDCDTCSNECCTYTVRVTATVLGAVASGTTVTVSNAILSAIASDSNCKCF